MKKIFAMLGVMLALGCSSAAPPPTNHPVSPKPVIPLTEETLMRVSVEIHNACMKGHLSEEVARSTFCACAARGTIGNIRKLGIISEDELRRRAAEAALNTEDLAECVKEALFSSLAFKVSSDN